MYKTILTIAIAAMLVGCKGGVSTSNNSFSNNTKEIDKTYTFLDSKEKNLDGFTVYWLKDNSNDKLFPFELFGNVSEDVKSAVAMPNGMPTSISAYLIKCNGKNILFDAGLGQNAGGQLLSELGKIGVAPENIHYVYITHFHGDHIGGMLTPQGNKTFSNAEVYVSMLEKNSDLGKSEQAAKMLEVYGNQIHTFEFGDTLPENVIAIDAVGHTPGHTVFQKGNLLIIGDLMHALALQLPYPEYCANFDGDKEKAIASRKRVLRYAQDNNLIISGMHLPY